MAERLVVLIENDPVLSERLRAVLAAYHLRVELVADGNELALRADLDPSLIILSIDPKRLGWAVCNKLKKAPQFRGVPLIVTSQEATDKDFEDHKKLRTRAEEYLHKPFSVELLLEKIASLIGLDPPQMEEPGIEEIPIDDAALIEEELLTEEPDAVSVDQEIAAETDAAFAAIGVAEEPRRAQAAQPAKGARRHQSEDEIELTYEDLVATGIRGLPTRDKSAPVAVAVATPASQSLPGTRASGASLGGDASLRAALEDAQRRAREAERRVDEVQRRMQEHDQKLREAQAAAERWRDERDYVASARDRAAAELERLNRERAEQVRLQEADAAEVAGLRAELMAAQKRLRQQTEHGDSRDSQELVRLKGEVQRLSAAEAEVARLREELAARAGEGEELARLKAQAPVVDHSGEVQRLRGELTTLLRQKNQLDEELAEVPALRQALAERDDGVRDELRKLREERDRLARDLRDLQAEGRAASGTGTGFSREREYINLREIINRKDKELLDLRDTLDSKERQVLDARDKARETERQRRDLDERLLEVEKEFVAARERLEALTQDKERAQERERGLKSRLEDAQKKAMRADTELQELRRQATAQLQQAEEALQRAQAAHAAERAALLDQAAERAAQEESARRALVAQHGSALEEQANRLREEHAAALAAVGERHIATLRGHQDDAERQLGELRAQAQAEAERLRGEMAARERAGEERIAALWQEQRKQLEAQRTEHEAERARLNEAVEQAQAANDGLVQQLRRTQQAVEEAAQVEERLEGELSRQREALVAGEGARQRLEAELAQEREARTAGEGARQRLEGELAQEREARAAAERSGAALAQELAQEREALGALRTEGERLRGELSAAQNEGSRLRGELAAGVAREESLRREAAALTEGIRQVRGDLESARGEITGLQAQVEGVGQELRAEREAAEHARAEAERVRVAEAVAAAAVAEALRGELTGERVRFADEQRARESLAWEFEQHRERSTAEVAALRTELESQATARRAVESEVAALQVRVRRLQGQLSQAYQRIKSDDGLVSRAKKALSIALTLLDESGAPLAPLPEDGQPTEPTSKD